MFLKKVEGPRAVTLPDGSTMTRADLPPENTRRWVASRKAAVVRGVGGVPPLQTTGERRSRALDYKTTVNTEAFFK